MAFLNISLITRPVFSHDTFDMKKHVCMFFRPGRHVAKPFLKFLTRVRKKKPCLKVCFDDVKHVFFRSCQTCQKCQKPQNGTLAHVGKTPYSWDPNFTSWFSCFTHENLQIVIFEKMAFFHFLKKLKKSKNGHFLKNRQKSIFTIYLINRGFWGPKMDLKIDP